jgi:hypothetical protein
MVGEQLCQRAERLGKSSMAVTMIEARTVYGDIAKDGPVLNGLVALPPKPACATRTCGTCVTKRSCLSRNNFLLQGQQKRLAVSNGEPDFSGAFEPLLKSCNFMLMHHPIWGGDCNLDRYVHLCCSLLLCRVAGPHNCLPAGFDVPCDGRDTLAIGQPLTHEILSFA